MTSEDAVRDSLRRRLLVMVTLGALALIAASSAVAILVAEDRSATQWVNHTYEVKDRLSDLRIGVSRAETDRRGFLITRDPDYVAQFERHAAPLMTLYAEVKALTIDNPRQQHASIGLKALIEARTADQKHTIQAVETGGALDVDAAVQAGETDVLAIRSLLDSMTAEEDRLLVARNQRETRDSQTLLVVATGSALSLLGLAGACYLLVRRYADDLDRSSKALRRLNTGLEDEVSRRTAELVRANTEIQRFAYIVSHDLRSPLVNVMGFTSEMELTLKPLRALLDRAGEVAALEGGRELREARAAIEHDIPESVGFIRASTQKMDRLINAILKLSREGRRNLTLEAIAMAALMGQIADTLKSQTEDRGATIEIDPALPDVISDRVAVEQVFSNILENALKYLKPGRPGRIAVRGRREGAAVVYEVEDNGRGIAPHDHERVFDLFRRAGVQDQPGEGIGLAHVRALVHRLGGAISVHSKLDQGATFRISLPPVLARPEDTPA